MPTVLENYLQDLVTLRNEQLPNLPTTLEVHHVPNAWYGTHWTGIDFLARVSRLTLQMIMVIAQELMDVLDVIIDDIFVAWWDGLTYETRVEGLAWALFFMTPLGLILGFALFSFVLLYDLLPLLLIASIAAMFNLVVLFYRLSTLLARTFWHYIVVSVVSVVSIVVPIVISVVMSVLNMVMTGLEYVIGLLHSDID